MGSSQAALRELTERWETQRIAHQLRVGELWQAMTEAAQRYASTDEQAGQAIDAVPELGRGAGRVPDLGL